ncbi:hypothetical protein QTP88_024268 [Uroleucon formosanum]
MTAYFLLEKYTRNDPIASKTDIMSERNNHNFVFFRPKKNKYYVGLRIVIRDRTKSLLFDKHCSKNLFNLDDYTYNKVPNIHQFQLALK